LASHSLAVVLGVVLVVNQATAATPPVLDSANVAATPTAPNTAVAAVPPNAAATRSFVAAAVAQVGPAVVRIDTERTVTSQAPTLEPLFNDPFFRQFFGEDFFPSPQQPRRQRERGQGSGFIISTDGTILTNAHVVAGADRVQVNLRDGRKFTGRVRGFDVVTDIAVVQIDAQGAQLPVARLGNSEGLSVGDWAIAIGNPLGLDNTVTLGIVSSIGRSSSAVGIPDKRLDLIQTDAAINPGNSGGPLVDAEGEVIGINTAIRQAPGGGIGFAIPINTASRIANQLLKNGSVAHPYLGVEMVTLTPELAREQNRDPNAVVQLPERNGVVVMRVRPNTPAAQSGLRRGDVILEIDGQPVTSAEQLQRRVENSQVGQTLTLSILRGGQGQQIRVQTGNLQPQPTAS
jgi:Do/DeqQ family serine protease